ncbi:hypothetical protein B0H17DRAFT_1205966 [Mycena rosella]|uniref:Uncharacterized protein n=1 Tax=Mycena rosella TaxID=1033263 RepID=A0AAD7D649_MYCRO|nr:hypothetical protein B0H17DRAFT_1205966 [Mycena rosella]
MYIFPIGQLDALILVQVTGWEQLPNLHDAPGVGRITIVDSWRDDHTHTSLAVSPYVHTLDVSGFTSIADLTSPTLLILNISCHGLSLQSVSALIQRSHCALHTLAPSEVDFRGTELLHLLPDLPALSSLTLAELLPYAISDTVLDALTLRTEDALSIHADRPPALPKLQHITIVGSYIFRDRALVRMLSSRGPHARNVAQLRALSTHGIKVGLVFLGPGKVLLAVNSSKFGWM